MSSTKANTNSFTHAEQFHDSGNTNVNNDNVSDDNDTNVESLSVELRALQTTLANKCNHHSVIVQLSATKCLCRMYMRSVQVANYLGVAVGVDVSSSLSVEIASLTTQTLSPLANTTFNISIN